MLLLLLLDVVLDVVLDMIDEGGIILDAVETLDGGEIGEIGEIGDVSSSILYID